VAQGVQRDVPGERGFLSCGSGARQDSRARLSHNAQFASFAGPSGHVGPCRADSEKPRRGLHAWRRGPPVTGWLAGFPDTGAACDSKPLLCEGYGFALPVPRRREAYQGCWPWSGHGGPRSSDFWRPGETGAVAWWVAGSQ
jgi:hypothetical protein